MQEVKQENIWNSYSYPEAVPQDGPSAGAAMTRQYILYYQVKSQRKVVLTGEIDLCKQVTAIGGVCQIKWS